MKRRLRLKKKKDLKPIVPKIKKPRRETITVDDFMRWITHYLELPKWKNPTAWDEHTFRVGVQLSLRKIEKSPLPTN